MEITGLGAASLLWLRATLATALSTGGAWGGGRRTWGGWGRQEELGVKSPQEPGLRPSARKPGPLLRAAK